MQTSLIKNLCKKKLRINVKEIIDMKKGYNGKIYLIKTDAQDLVLKFQKADFNRLVAETWVLKELADKSIPVPKVLITDFNKHFIIEERLHGSTLKDSKLPNNKKAEILGEIGANIKKIHQIKTTGYGYFSKPLVGSAKTWKEHIGNDFYEHLNILKDKKIINNELISNIEKIYNGKIDLLKFNKPKLLHGDLRFENFIVNKGKLNGIIDAGEAISGDPAYDLINIYADITKYDKNDKFGFMESFQSGYGKINMEKLRFYMLGLLIWDLRFFSIIKKNNKEFNTTLSRVNTIIQNGL